MILLGRVQNTALTEVIWKAGHNVLWQTDPESRIHSPFLLPFQKFIQSVGTNKHYSTPYVGIRIGIGLLCNDAA
jgi:hypothetical protein